MFKRKPIQNFNRPFCLPTLAPQVSGEALICQKGYDESQLPSRQTIGAILNRMGYRLKKHKKSNP